MENITGSSYNMQYLLQYHITCNITFSVFFSRHAFSSYFDNLKFTSHQIIKSLIYIELITEVRGTEFSNIVFLTAFLNWLTWCSTLCVEEIRWSQSRNRHKRKVRETYSLNMVFLRSFLTWLISRKTPYFPSQSKLVRTSSGVNHNKI